MTSSSTGEAPIGSDVSFGVGGKTLTVDLSAHHDGSTNDYYGAAEAIATAINGDSDLQALDYSAAAATLAVDINADAALQALDYSATADTSNPWDIIIFRANTPITQADVAAAPQPRLSR